MRLGAAVQHVPDEPAGVDAVGALGDRAQRTGEAESARDDGGEFDRRRGDQPHPLPRVEMHLGERPGAGPDLVGHQLVEDLLADLHHLVDGAPGHEGQGLFPAGLHTLVVLPAADPELDLLPGEPGQIGGAEVPAGRQAAGEVEDRRAHHHRVVHVEERGGGQVGGCGRARCRDPGHGFRGGLRLRTLRGFGVRFERRDLGALHGHRRVGRRLARQRGEPFALPASPAAYAAPPP